MATILLLGHAAAAWSIASSQFVVFGEVAIAMGLGSYLGELRVTEVLAENVTTSSLVLVSGSLGLPVSTTHISSSAIIGIGLLQGRNNVSCTTVRDMVLAWLITLPASALLASIAYFILLRVL